MFAPSFLCGFVSLYMFGLPSGQMPTMAQALHYVTVFLLFAYDHSRSVRAAITVSIVLQIALDVLTAVAYVAYIGATEDASVQYYWDFCRMCSLFLICLADLIIYPSVLVRLYDQKITPKPVHATGWLMFALYVSEACVLLTTYLIAAAGNTDSWTVSAFGVSHACLFVSILVATSQGPRVKTN